MKNLLSICLAALSFVGCTNQSKTAVVLTGLDRVAEHESLFTGKKIGIITNHTAYNIKDKHILRLHLRLDRIDLFKDVRFIRISECYNVDLPVNWRCHLV